MPKTGVIINSSAHTAANLDMSEIKSTIYLYIPNAKTYIVKQSVEQTINKAVKDGCEVLCAGGGDGTVSAVAAACIENNLILGVIPLGTMNNFAKDMGIPTELKAACKVIAKQNIKKIDYGTMNGKAFINNSSLGIYPRLVKEREKREGRNGKFFAYFTGFFSTIHKFRVLNLQIKYDDKEVNIITPLVFISNNDYSLSEKPFNRRPTLTGGTLSVHIIRHDKFGSIGAFRNILTRRMGQASTYQSLHTKKITISSNTPKITIAKDGEIMSAKLPLEYTIQSKRLKVIAP